MDKNFYTSHAASMWLKSVASVCVATFLSTATYAQGVVKPTNIKATENNGYVTLSWDRVANADILLNEGFEDDTMPEGWKVKTTNTYDKTFTWFNFPTPEQKEQAEEDETEDELNTWRHTGNGSAVVSWDQVGEHPDGTAATQDEWLMTPATEGAQYVDFYTYIDPMVLEYGANDEFPDHYYVKVSHDNGSTWKTLWDARYDSDGSDGWQHVSLYLGDASEGAPIVAFQAVGDQTDPTSGLYFTWAIDDVQLYKDGNASASDVPAASYNVLLDNNVIASGLKSTSFTDKSDKTAGTHVYGIQAVAGDKTAEPVETKVEVHAPTLNAPTNVKAEAEYDEQTGKYNVTLSWDAPEGDRTPSYYVCYANDAMFAGWVEPDEHSVEQTGVNHGVQYYAVKAVYENPDGESELVGDLVAMGTRNTPSDLKAELSDGDVKLSWKAPKASEYDCEKYAIYRGNDFVANVDVPTTEYTDEDAPEGKYDYAVKAVYNDNVVSLPATAEVNNGTKVYAIPFEENFNGGLKPADWTIERVNTSMKTDYLWRFDNWYELPVVGGGFEGGFASMCSSISPMVSMFAVLESPAIKAEVKNDEKVVMEFDIDYSSVEKAVSQKSNAGLRYSYDQDEWADACDEFTGYSADGLAQGETCKPQHMTIDVTKCFESGKPVYFGWYYEAKNAQHIAIDNVKVYSTSTSGINNINATTGKSSTMLYNLNGQRVNGSRNSVAPGVYIQGGKKIVVK